MDSLPSWTLFVCLHRRQGFQPAVPAAWGMSAARRQGRTPMTSKLDRRLKNLHASQGWLSRLVRSSGTTRRICSATPWTVGPGARGGVISGDGSGKHPLRQVCCYAVIVALTTEHSAVVRSITYQTATIAGMMLARVLALCS